MNQEIIRDPGSISDFNHASSFDAHGTILSIPESHAAPDAKSQRLRFIDMARSIAILMMLEGHFVGLTLKESAHTKGWMPYDVWYYIRGITAPIFFTVTGMVFAFLLCRPDNAPKFFQITRVRKGLIRTIELLFWGYLLQLNLLRFPEYLQGGFGNWALAFHVLQCIGAGLFVMILIFGLHRSVGRGPVWPWFACGAVFFYLGGVVLTSIPEKIGFPAGAPTAIQNIFHGESATFTVFPWLAFALYGATFGALLRQHIAVAKSHIFPLAIIGVGLAMFIWGGKFDRAVAHAVGWLMQSDSVEPLLWFHLRAGTALMILGVLMAWENFLGMRESRFLTIGRNTFPIYVLHVIVLYGGIFGLGINDWLTRKLEFHTALIGALIFLLSFAFLAQIIAPLSARWRTFKESLLNRKNNTDA